MERISRFDFLALIALAFGLAFTMGMVFEHASLVSGALLMPLIVLLVGHLFLAHDAAFPE